MIRYIIACVVAGALVTGAFAQQEEARPGEAEVRAFIDELAQDLAKDADAYIDRLSFPVQISVVTADGKVHSGVFNEEEYRLLGYSPGESIRIHTAQQALMKEMHAMMERQRAAANNNDETAEEEPLVEEELALMPRERVVEEVTVRTMDTEVQFLNEHVAFARTTLCIGEEPLAAGAAAEEEPEETLVEEELAVRPERGQAMLDLGALLIRENGEWRVKNIVTGDTKLYGHE